MARRFVFSDPHWNHPNIRFVPGRERFREMPIEQHDQVLVDRWNSVVGKRDVVYLLGDIGMDRPAGYIATVVAQLNGRIEVVGGNHDTAEILQLFDKVHGVMVKSVAGYRCVITHIPIHPQELFWDFNIHGHLHSNVVKKWACTPEQSKLPGPTDPRYINACGEHSNFYPVELDALVEQRLKVYTPPRRKQ